MPDQVTETNETKRPCEVLPGLPSSPSEPSMEELIALLENNPDLLKSLEKKAKTTATLERRTKPRLELIPSFVNQIELNCQLCGTHSTVWVMMEFDPNPSSRGFRSSVKSPVNKWPSWSIRKTQENSKTCEACSSVLSGFSKEKLIELLILNTSLLNIAPLGVFAEEREFDSVFEPLKRKTKGTGEINED